MDILFQWAKQNPQWSLEEFVEVINQILPQFLPFAKNNTKVRAEVTPRLVRHYTSVGMIDEPKKVGKYAIYTYRHLLQLLLVRRLLAEGMSASLINDLAKQKTNKELENWLTGEVQLEVSQQNNSALDYLQQLRQRESSSRVKTSTSNPTNYSPPAEDYSNDESPTASLSPNLNHSQWTHWEILPGLELKIRSDFKFPKNLSQQKQLLSKIQNLIEFLSTSSEKKP